MDGLAQVLEEGARRLGGRWGAAVDVLGVVPRTCGSRRQHRLEVRVVELLGLVCDDDVHRESALGVLGARGEVDRRAVREEDGLLARALAHGADLLVEFRVLRLRVARLLAVEALHPVEELRDGRVVVRGVEDHLAEGDADVDAHLDQERLAVLARDR